MDRLERDHGRVVITKHGRPAAVVISVEDLESLEETPDVMGSAAVLDDIRETLTEVGTADARVAWLPIRTGSAGRLKLGVEGLYGAHRGDYLVTSLDIRAGGGHLKSGPPLRIPRARG